MLSSSEVQNRPQSYSIQTLDDVRSLAEVLRQRMRAAVQGRDEVIEFVLYALLGDGHILLEDYPGSGKTTLAKALGQSIETEISDTVPHFRRVQFTPDLLPSDITGVMIFDTENNEFSFRKGPLFAYIILADEINRTSPKVQSALLEAMAEKQITVDNVTHPLDKLFFVIATQNPLDLMGTYPLPVSQLDRFLFKIKMTHISREAELEVLAKWNIDRLAPNLPKISRNQIIGARQVLRQQVKVSEPVMACLVDTLGNLRENPAVVQGASTRSLVMAIPALQARAALMGRDFVSSEDIEVILLPLLLHRIELQHSSEEKSAMIMNAAKPALEKLARDLMKA